MIIVLDEGYRPLAERRLAGHELRFYPPAISEPGRLADLLTEADVLGMRRALTFHVDEAVLGRAERLKFIHKSGSGEDHFDAAALSAMGILLALNSGFNAVSVAEHAVTMILLCLRRTHDYAALMRDGGWAFGLPGDTPMLLAGKTVGLIGVGAIGSRIARAMIAMDAEVIAYHPDPRRAMAPGVAWAALDDLMARADVISIQVPLKPETRGMIGAHELSLAKPTAVLVNTARGEIVDEVALAVALRDGRLRAGGLDVFWQEPLPMDHPLRELPNLFATPHIAGVVKEIIERQIEGTIANIEVFAAGARPERLVNPEILSDGRARARHLHSA